MKTKPVTLKSQRLVIPLEELQRADVGEVGGKSSSLGEMIRSLSQSGVRVPGGFSTTSLAYRDFLEENGLFDKIHGHLSSIDTKDNIALAKAGLQCREWIKEGAFSHAFIAAVSDELNKLVRAGVKSVAVRSSATAEDLPDASFAGQQLTLLNVPTKLGPLLLAIKEVVASLFEDRAIAYREEQGFDHRKVALCACIQQMVRSDKAVAGVMFTCDSETGHSGVIGITAVWGLGELAVGGSNTDEFTLGKPTNGKDVISILSRRLGNQDQKLVFAKKDAEGHFTKLVPTSAKEKKTFCLSDSELRELGRFAITIEKHYRCPMDIEWAKDGVTGKLYVVQARPVTTNDDHGGYVETYSLEGSGYKPVATGIAVGRRIASGAVKVLKNSSVEELAKIKPGDVLVARMTDPNYVPAMRLASAIITEEGSTKCHAAIIARELKKPAVVACAGVLGKFSDGEEVTVSCADGSVGRVYLGKLKIKVKRTKIGNLPALTTKLRMNVGDPGQALQASMLPHSGVGLARQEFIINSVVGIHPQACLDYKKLSPELREDIRKKTAGYKDPRDFYVRKLAEGIGLICRAFYPERVIVRLSDFKTNEYRELLGGPLYEKHEENPMLGFRGAARYIDPAFQKAFDMECEALRIVRGEMELTNCDIMVPFVRTLQEGRKVVNLLAKNGLTSSQGENGLRIGMMCELPSNVVLADKFVHIFDFASIGSNDLTQLVLGADRDSGCNFGDERDEAVLRQIEQAIMIWRSVGKSIGICGQAPSDHPGFAEWLAAKGITTISLNPDSIVPVWRRLAKTRHILN